MIRCSMPVFSLLCCMFYCMFCAKLSTGQTPIDERAEFIRGNYTKTEVRIPLS